MFQKSQNDCVPWVGPHTGAGKEGKEERVLETCNELTVTSIFLELPCGEELGVKFSLQERKRKVEGRCFYISSSPYPTLFK